MADLDKRTVRIDTAHVPDSAAANQQPLPRQDAFEAVLSLSQVRTQATQLAGHLDSMRGDLDRREAELNVRLAALEKDQSAARLWLREREFELEERARQLEESQQQLEESKSQLVGEFADGEADGDGKLRSSIQQAMAKLRAERAAQEVQLRRRQQRLQLREQALKELSCRLLKNVERHRIASEEENHRRERQIRLLQQKAFQEDYQRAADEFESRQKYLDNAEALLVNNQADLEVQQNQLKIQRQRAEEELRAARTAIAKRQHQLEIDWQERQTSLSRRAEQLDSRETALEQTRREVAATHREALELRLATEELWAKLTEVLPAAALTTELGKIRRKLAESYCMERNAAARKVQELDEFQQRLAEQYVKLTSEKKELHDWVRFRQEDIEQQAARLVAREQELAREELNMQRTGEEWDAERREYQAEIRGLITQLRRAKDRQADRFELASVQ